MARPRECSSCKQGEVSFIDGLDGDVHRATVRDPDNGQIVIGPWLCDNHIVMYEDDGYSVKVQKEAGK